jgi:DNA-binding HxlR family transcriptional regulator
MKKSSKTGEEQCPVDYAFQRIGGKYKGRIISHLRDKVKRYGELRRVLEDITPKMLTQALRELEKDELIKRTVYLEVPPRVEYELTETGRQLVPFITMLTKWAREQMIAKDIRMINEEEKEKQQKSRKQKVVEE